MADDLVTYRELQTLLAAHADRVENKIDELSTDIAEKLDGHGDRVRLVEDSVLTMKINEENRRTKNLFYQGMLTFVITTILNIIGLFWKR